jgi:hypothetical protein
MCNLIDTHPFCLSFFYQRISSNGNQSSSRQAADCHSLQNRFLVAAANLLAAAPPLTAALPTGCPALGFYKAAAFQSRCKDTRN